MTKNTFKASLRSKKNIDVEKVARQFEGGGHMNASACRIAGDIKSVKEQLIGAILNIASD
jgi:phosphoesterase RecJ-like protein